MNGCGLPKALSPAGLMFLLASRRPPTRCVQADGKSKHTTSPFNDVKTKHTSHVLTIIAPMLHKSSNTSGLRVQRPEYFLAKNMSLKSGY